MTAFPAILIFVLAGFLATNGAQADLGVSSQLTAVIDRIEVAQAPGAGGARVAPVPSTPTIQQMPVPQPSPPATAPAGPKFEIRNFDVDGATLIDAARIAALLQPFTGPGREFGDVQRALEALEKLFVDAGYGSVQVLLPEQELDQGTVKFKVLEPRIGKVLVEGNVVYTEANIRASLPSLREGQAPNSNAIAADLRLANEKGRATPTMKAKAGWMRSCSEHPVHGACQAW